MTGDGDKDQSVMRDDGSDSTQADLRDAILLPVSVRPPRCLGPRT